MKVSTFETIKQLAPIRIAKVATRGIHATHVWFLPVDVLCDFVKEQARLGFGVDSVNLDQVIVVKHAATATKEGGRGG